MGTTYANGLMEAILLSLGAEVNQVLVTCTSPLTDAQVSTLGNPANEANLATLNVPCLSSTDTTTSLGTSLNQQVQPVAREVITALNLSPSSPVAQNIIILTGQLAMALLESYTQVCSTVITQSQIATVDTNIPVINKIETASDELLCLRSTSSVGNVQAQLLQQMLPVAQTYAEAYLIQGAVIVIMLVILVGLLIFKGFLWFILTLFIFIVVYIILAWWLKWWPFNKSGSNTSTPVGLIVTDSNGGTGTTSSKLPGYTIFPTGTTLKLTSSVTTTNLYDNGSLVGGTTNGIFTINSPSPGKHNYYVISSVIQPVFIGTP